MICDLGWTPRSFSPSLILWHFAASANQQYQIHIYTRFNEGLQNPSQGFFMSVRHLIIGHGCTTIRYSNVAPLFFTLKNNELKPSQRYSRVITPQNHFSWQIKIYWNSKWVQSYWNLNPSNGSNIFNADGSASAALEEILLMFFEYGMVDVWWKVLLTRGRERSTNNVFEQEGGWSLTKHFMNGMDCTELKPSL